MITHTLHQMEKDTVASIKSGGGMSIVVAQTETKELRIVRRNVTRIQAVKVIWIGQHTIAVPHWRILVKYEILWSTEANSIRTVWATSSSNIWSPRPLGTNRPMFQSKVRF